MMLAIGVPARHEPAQAVEGAELGVNQRDQMVPAAKRLVIGVAVAPLDDGGELASVDGFKKLAEDGRRKAHAPFLFLSLDNQKITGKPAG
jgi:hypothetical protein